MLRKLFLDSTLLLLRTSLGANELQAKTRLPGQMEAPWAGKQGSAIAVVADEAHGWNMAVTICQYRIVPHWPTSHLGFEDLLP